MMSYDKGRRAQGTTKLAFNPTTNKMLYHMEYDILRIKYDVICCPRTICPRMYHIILYQMYDTSEYEIDTHIYV